MSIHEECAVSWGWPQTDSHRLELHCLTAHAPGAHGVHVGLVASVACVVGIEAGVLVAATVRDFYRAQGAGQARQYGSHWILEADGLQVTHLGGPQARRLVAQSRTAIARPATH